MTPNPNDLIHEDCPNFKWYEVWKSSTAERLEIDNTSDDEEILENARNLTYYILQPLRDTLGPIKPNSWFRGEKLEKVITKKGFKRWAINRGMDHKAPATWDAYFARKSHPRAQACDIEVAGISNDALFELIKENFEYDQLIREFPVEGVPDSGWVHVSWAGKEKNRNQAFTIGAK